MFRLPSATIFIEILVTTDFNKTGRNNKMWRLNIIRHNYSHGYSISSLFVPQKKFGCWPNQNYLNSFLILMLPWTWNVANLVCHTPSNWIRAMSLPTLTQSMICSSSCSRPHSVKGTLSSLVWLSISYLWPPCLVCMWLILFTTYCFWHFLHVMR